MAVARRSGHRRLVAVAALLCSFVGSAMAQTMTFVMDPFPPFTYEENGVAAGPMSDVIIAVCEALKVPCKLESYPWRRALRLAEEGQVDGIYAVVNIPERQQFFYLSPPIVESAYGVFVRESSTLKYRGPMDLDGYTVGAYGPSAASKVLESMAQTVPNLTQVTEVDNSTLLRKLSGGRYGDHGAAVANADVAQYLIRQNQIPGLRFAGAISKTEYCVGLSKAKVSEKQAQEFNAALRQLIKSGKVRAIAEKYGVVAAAH